MRILILGSPYDPTVRIVAQRMAARHGAAAVLLRRFEDLAGAVWTHRVGCDGVAAGIHFRDGASLNTFRPDLVFNRLTFPATLLFPGWSAADRNYGIMELFGLLLSALQGLSCPVVNRAGPAGLSGPLLRGLVWCAHAAAAGLSPHGTGATTSTRHFPPPASTQQRTDLLATTDEAACSRIGLDRPVGHVEPAHAVAEVLVIGNQVLGSNGLGVAPACLRLAQSVGTDLLAIRLARGKRDLDWRFVAADPGAQIAGVAAETQLIHWLEARAASA